MNVKFYSVKLKSTFEALEVKDSLALYWIVETSELYKGDQLFGVGALATKEAAGLLSAEDKVKLDELVAASGKLNLTAVDGTIKLADISGGKSIGVAISTHEGNALVAVEDGLFVPVAKEMSIPEYAIEKQEIAEDGYATSYKLKKTVNGESTYVGDVINIGKDMVLQGATLETVVETDVPYMGAVVGDPYIDMAFNDVNASHIYVPVKGLVDTYTAGVGIEMIDGKIAVKIADNSHGLVAVDGAMTMLLATAEQDGAMSKEDKSFIDSIPGAYATIERVNETAVQVKYEVSSKPEGTIVDYRGKEIRVMCPANTKWTKQNVGANGDANMYYMGFKAYAPEGAVSFKEDDQATIADQTMYYFENNDFAGIDEFGRKYSIVWLALASYNEVSDTWTYFGEKSSSEKYIGWYYTVEWYDANGVMIDTDQIRINLSNEECHNVATPYYMSEYATIDQLTALEESVTDTFTWGEM
jgi:hypothetical protein